MGRLSGPAKRLVEREPSSLSPAVLFELEVLFERGRIKRDATTIVSALSRTLDLSVSETPFSKIVDQALTFAWTHDPFDRLIVANAIADGVRLITADALILANFQDAVW